MFAAGAIVLTSNLSAGDLPNVKRNTDYHSVGERLAQVVYLSHGFPVASKSCTKRGFLTMMLDEGLECKYKWLSGVLWVLGGCVNGRLETSRLEGR